MQAADFDYHLPESSIAQSAIEPRDASRLLVASTREDRTFADLPQILSAGDLLVVNRTRVRPARLHGVKRETGGSVEVLLLRRLDQDRWEALVRPARRIRTGMELRLGPITGVVRSDPVRGVAIVALHADSDVEDLLAVVGEVPLPPYFHGELPDVERYQTIFAKEPNSAAAPTAALHFTPRLVDHLGSAGIDIAAVDLHVGLDTFLPMADGPLESHEMYREWFEVPGAAVAAIERTRATGGRIVAVGTTVVRALESAASRGELVPTSGATDLFIKPGYRFRVIDALVTNFHAPRTTLVALVASLLGSRWREVYEHAVRTGYRFLSFGDAMLIDRPTPGDET